MPKFDALEAQSFSSPRPTQAPVGIWANGASVGTQPLINFRNAQGTVLSSINSDGSITAPNFVGNVGPQKYITGGALYYFTNPLSAAPATAGVQYEADQQGYFSPWFISNTIVVQRIGLEMKTGATGGGTPVLRIVIFNDTGSGYPGTVYKDCGTVASSGTASVEITLSTALTMAPGLYWVGAVSQGVVTAQPYVYTYPSVLGNIAQTTTIPTTGSATYYTAYTMTSMGTGAITAAFSTTVTPSAIAPVIFVRVQ